MVGAARLQLNFVDAGHNGGGRQHFRRHGGRHNQRGNAKDNARKDRVQVDAHRGGEGQRRVSRDLLRLAGHADDGGENPNGAGQDGPHHSTQTGVFQAAGGNHRLDGGLSDGAGEKACHHPSKNLRARDVAPAEVRGRQHLVQGLPAAHPIDNQIAGHYYGKVECETGGPAHYFGGVNPAHRGVEGGQSKSHKDRTPQTDTGDGHLDDGGHGKQLQRDIDDSIQDVDVGISKCGLAVIFLFQKVRHGTGGDISAERRGPDKGRVQIVQTANQGIPRARNTHVEAVLGTADDGYSANLKRPHDHGDTQPGEFSVRGLPAGLRFDFDSRVYTGAADCTKCNRPK